MVDTYKVLLNIQPFYLSGIIEEFCTIQVIIPVQQRLSFAISIYRCRLRISEYPRIVICFGAALLEATLYLMTPDGE